MDTDQLRKFALFEGMSDEDLAASVEVFEPIRRMAGERVTKEDDFGYSLFLILEGRVKVEAGDQKLAELEAGDHFGEVSLVTGEKRNATVTALETCELAKTMIWDFGALTERYPILAQRVKAVADQRLNE